MLSYIYSFLFFAIPVSMVAFSGISLYRFVRAVSANKKNPGAFSADEIKKRRLLFIVSAVIAAVLVAVVVGFIALLFMAVAYM